MFRFRWKIFLWFALNSSNSDKLALNSIRIICCRLIYFFFFFNAPTADIVLLYQEGNREPDIPWTCYLRNFLFSSSSLRFCFWNTVVLNNTAIFTSGWSIILLLLSKAYKGILKLQAPYLDTSTGVCKFIQYTCMQVCFPVYLYKYFFEARDYRVANTWKHLYIFINLNITKILAVKNDSFVLTGEVRNLY